jgi:hypothetical protein
MTPQRDIGPILERWFVDGVDQMPDRVYLTILDRVEREPQRPSWRLHPWRFPTMPTPIKLVAIGAALLAVLVGGAVFIGGGSARSAPTPTPAPTSAPVALAGTVHYQLNGAAATTEVDATATGTILSGTAVTTFGGATHTVRLACAARDGDIWALAGTIEQSTIQGEPIGDWSAVIVKDGPDPQIGVWLSDPVRAGSDCDGWLASIDIATIGPENLKPMESGELKAPPDL